MRKEMFKNQSERFSRYQSVIAATRIGDRVIDLWDISHDFLFLNDDDEMHPSIRYIPLEGHFVYVDTDDDHTIEKSVKVDISNLSSDLLGRINDLLRKCMIIVELRDGVNHEQE